MTFAQWPLLAGLDAAALAQLEAASHRFSAVAGETLFRQGDTAHAIYLLIQGRVGIISRTPGDGEVDVVEAGPGAMIGELGLLDGGNRSATARAITDCHGMAIGLGRFRGLAASGQPAAFALADRIRIEVAGRFRATVAAIAAQPEYEKALVRAAATRQMPQTSKPGPVSAMLKGLVRFAAITSDDAERLAAMGNGITVPRGTLIASAGDAADALSIILRGAVRTGLARDEGIEPLAVHGPGDYAGLAAMIDRKPHPLTIETAETSILLQLGRDGFEALRSETGELAHLIFDLAGRQLVRDLRRANRHLGRARALSQFRSQGHS